MLTPQQYEEHCKRLDEGRSKRRADLGVVWPTPEDAGTGVIPIEIAPGRGDLSYSSTFYPSFPSALSLINRVVSFARLFQSQPWIAAACMRMLTWAIRVPLKAYQRTGADPADRRQLHPGD